MDKKISKILALINDENEQNKKKILLECVSRIGSEEWKEDVQQWIERLNNIN